MKISTVTLHNFRSIKDSKFDLYDFTLLVGENNVGKSNIITALRVFYEDEKFSAAKDFPKFETEDNDSWIEIEFLTSEDEQENLKEEYKSEDKKLILRKYLQSNDNDLVKSNQSNIYAYENGELSKNLFYGAKNISQAKIGKIIFIPEVSKTDDSLKMTGPSPFRDMVNFVLKKVITKSESFKTLNSSFESFNTEFKKEASETGFSLKKLEEDINDQISYWKINFGIDINPIQPDDIVKNLISHFITDQNLGNQKININQLGQGLQRHLIYSLIKLSAKYVDVKEEKRKEFSPDFTLILFEEPEAFLHPSQQEVLNRNLKQLSKEPTQQILITTHSSTYVSKSSDELVTIVRLKKDESITTTHQLNKVSIESLYDSNLGFFRRFSTMLTDPLVPENIKQKIRNKNLGNPALDEVQKLEEETIRYFLWLDAERSSLFFAKHIVVCEGATEKVFFEYLSNNLWSDIKDKHVYFLDAMGKFNIHRYINLFEKLGISHSILIDKDNDADIQGIVNQFLTENKGSLTKKIESFPVDFESYLNIPKPPRQDLKPLNALYQYKQGNIQPENIDRLRELIETLI